MIDHPAPASTVLVILDRHFGARLREVPAGRPIWVVASLENDSVVDSLWQDRASDEHAAEITRFQFGTAREAEDCLITKLDMIDLHHGPHSSTTPYTELEVIGVQPTAKLRSALAELGFPRITLRDGGFLASRATDEIICR